MPARATTLGPFASFLASLLLLLVLPVSAEASKPQPPPCDDTECRAKGCEGPLARLATSKPNPPAAGKRARCIEVSLPIPGDACEYEKRLACHCDAVDAAPGTVVVTTGLPGHAALADEADDACVTAGDMPGSCLLRGRDVRCKLGDDCTSVCDAWRARSAAELDLGKNARAVASECNRRYDQCNCILEVGGGCFVGSTEDTRVSCTESPAAAFDAWVDRANAAAKASADDSCHRGSCAVTPSAASPTASTFALAAVLGAVAAGITLRRRAASRGR